MISLEKLLDDTLIGLTENNLTSKDLKPEALQAIGTLGMAVMLERTNEQLKELVQAVETIGDCIVDLGNGGWENKPKKHAMEVNDNGR